MYLHFVFIYGRYCLGVAEFCQSKIYYMDGIYVKLIMTIIVWFCDV